MIRLVIILLVLGACGDNVSHELADAGADVDARDCGPAPVAPIVQPYFPRDDEFTCVPPNEGGRAFITERQWLDVTQFRVEAEVWMACKETP